MSKMIFSNFTVDYIEVVTEKAIKVVKDDTPEWIPRSVLSSATDGMVDVGLVDVTLEIHEWFTEKKGW